jgi:UPF0755 protein
MPRKSFRLALAIVVATVVIGLVAGAIVVAQVLSYPSRRHGGSGQAVQVEVESGMSFPAIADRLHTAGLIDRPRWFRLYAMQRGVTTKVRTGKYTLRDDMTPEQVLDALLAGVQDVTVPVTIPEGQHFQEVFAIIAQAGVADAAELEARCRDAQFLAARGIEGETCEGYLFPETYRFRVPSPPDEVLDRMIEQHRIVWDEIRRTHARPLERLKAKMKWTDRDVLILASIVEKEAVVDAERPRIAQVFLNRLTSPSFVPHRLDTDPTIRYGCTIPLRKSAGCQKWDPTQRLRRAQLDDADNPYNTYQHEGLPPGPIGNPGRASLTATVDPDGSDYFYFVSRNDGTHVFSKTRAEHERKVDAFQR